MLFYIWSSERKILGPASSRILKNWLDLNLVLASSFNAKALRFVSDWKFLKLKFTIYHFCRYLQVLTTFYIITTLFYFIVFWNMINVHIFAIGIWAFYEIKYTNCLFFKDTDMAIWSCGVNVEFCRLCRVIYGQCKLSKKANLRFAIFGCRLMTQNKFAHCVCKFWLFLMNFFLKFGLDLRIL